MRGENGHGSDIVTKTWKVRRMKADEEGSWEKRVLGGKGQHKQSHGGAGRQGVLTQGILWRLKKFAAAEV